MRGGIGGDDPKLVAAVGKGGGVEAEELVGEGFFEGTPDGFAVAAEEEVVGEVVGVVVVGGPADGYGGFVLLGL